MNPTTKNIILLLSCIVIIKACTEFRTDKKTVPIKNDIVYEQLEMENKQLQTVYSKKLKQLEKQTDSLTTLTEVNKKQLSVYRFKAKLLQNQLKEVIANADSVNPHSDSIAVLTNQYIEAENQRDSTCNVTIYGLTEAIETRDSIITVYKQSDENHKTMQRIQQLRIEQLTNDLNTAYKVQKKTELKSKVLKGGLFFLSGLAATLFVVQAAK